MGDQQLLEFAPSLAPHVLIGPPMQVGTRVMHYVKNTLTLRYYRLGVRESFLLSQINGSNTLQSIGKAYRARFGVELSQGGMTQILRLLDDRGLLASPGKPADDTAQASTPRFNIKRFGEVYFCVANPMRLLSRIVKLLARFNDRAAAIIVAMTILCCELYAIAHYQALSATLSASFLHPEPRVVFAFIGLTYFAAILHEIGHGAMCVKFGGRVVDMGLMFRYLMFFPYCKLDDLVILPNAMARTLTVLAGVMVNLLLLLPFVILDLVTPEGTMLKQLCAYMLGLYNLISLLNLLPFLRLDGYMLVSICRGQPELKEEAFSEIRRQWQHQGPASARRINWPLLLYGTCYAATAFAAAIWSLYMWNKWLFGPVQHWAALVLLEMAVIALITFLVRKKNSRQALVSAKK